MRQSGYLTAKEAAAALGVTLPTLYAYVSRGLLRSEALDGDPRSRRYRAEDVETLKARKESRLHPEMAAESALHLGMPVLESSITLISDGKLYYRGRDAVELARRESVERVAALIWTGDLEASTAALHTLAALPRSCRTMLREINGLSAFQKFQVLLPIIAADDFAAYDLRPEAVVQTGGRILRLMTLMACNLEAGDIDMVAMLHQAWTPDDAQAADLLRAALILCADHELNASSFTARCVASTNATPYAAVLGGLAALGGSKHGGHTERVEALWHEAGSAERVAQVMAGRLRRGEAIPGFGHPLYPQGDPRGRELLGWVTAAYPNSEAAALAEAAAHAGMELMGQWPTIDLGLVALCRARGLPDGTALTIFALGRTLGWIGHAIQQYRLDQLIRPRAKYVGEKPFI